MCIYTQYFQLMARKYCSFLIEEGYALLYIYLERKHLSKSILPL